MAKEKPCNIVPPKKKMESKARSVVKEVIIVLESVSLIERLEISSIFFDVYFLNFSYSIKNTTVSFIE